MSPMDLFDLALMFGAIFIIGMAVHGNCLTTKSCYQKAGMQALLMALLRNLTMPGPLRWITENP